MAVPFAIRDFNFHVIIFAKFKHSDHSYKFNDDSVAILIKA